MPNLSDLIAKLESASEGSRELDAEIWWHIGKPTFAEKPNRDPEWWAANPHLDPDATWGLPVPLLEIIEQKLGPHYTTSLDSALTLVPEGAWWLVGRDTGNDSPLRNFGSRGGSCFHAQCDTNYGVAENKHRAATPALSLTIAALKARQATTPQDPQS